MNIIKKIQKHFFPKTLKCIYRKDILEYALKYNHEAGACYAIQESLLHYGFCPNIDRYLPLHNLANAKRFKAEIHPIPYWWPLGDWTNRIQYLQWLLDQYKDDKTNLKKL